MYICSNVTPTLPFGSSLARADIGTLYKSVVKDKLQHQDSIGIGSLIKPYPICMVAEPGSDTR